MHGSFFAQAIIEERPDAQNAGPLVLILPDLGFILGEQKIIITHFAVSLPTLPVIQVEGPENITSLLPFPIFMAIDGKNAENRLFISFGPLDKGPRKVPLGIMIVLVIGVIEKGPDHRPGDPLGGYGGYIERKNHGNFRRVVRGKVTLFKMKNGPEEKHLLVIFFFAFIAQQRPDFKSLSSAPLGAGENRPKQRIGAIFPFAGRGIEGPKEKVQFIFSKTLLQGSVNGKKTAIGFALLRFSPESQKETPFFFLLIFPGQIPAGGEEGHEIRLHLFFGLLVFSQGIKIFQQGVLPFFLLPVKEGAESQILFLRIFAVGEKGSQNIGFFPFPGFILAI
jgi:hypothetical protein